jgi:2-polyprenyl-3-methyl-5-hydroxy-6-metoxy-1,4-benzoquinol methylase
VKEKILKIMPSIRDDRGYNQGYRPSKSLDVRNRRRCRYMLERMKKDAGTSTLEIGCGTGALSFMIAGQTAGRVTGSDICAPFIAQARKNYKLKNLSYMILDFNSIKDVKKRLGKSKFDNVVGNGILHHLYYNLDESLKNINSLLKKGGAIVFQEPNIFNPYCFLIFNIPIFRKMARLEPGEMAFSPAFIRKKLANAGFENIIIEYRDFLVPGIPDSLISLSIAAGDIIEKIPVLNMAAQSIFITANKK